ncbi:unnamed protein product [Echinostoma caproni]|uniref:NOT2_3_5 domain-containing protein n=1 Tax=Echinostoma caproni TaxID=27848 RepID=A0A183B2J7_9TREM|nr:unnamed protein product [Echinostoma caproni]
MELKRNNIRPFTLEDFLVMSSGANLNGDFVLPHSVGAEYNFPATQHHYTTQISQQQHPQQNHPYAVPARVPNPPAANWYGGSQPSLDSQTHHLVGMNMDRGVNIMPGLYRSVELPNARIPGPSTSSQYPNSRLANHRARLRRSNTVGSSEIGQHLPMAMAKTSMAPYHPGPGASRPGFSLDPISYLLGQPPVTGTLDSGPIGTGALTGPSPTERVLRRLAQMNASASLDRNGTVGAGSTGVMLGQSNRFDWSRGIRPNLSMLGQQQQQQSDGNLSDAVKGSRRSRLRREVTMDATSGNLLQSRESMSHPHLGPYPPESSSLTQSSPFALMRNQQDAAGHRISDGQDVVPSELCFSSEQFQEQSRFILFYLLRDMRYSTPSLFITMLIPEESVELISVC